MTGLAEVFREEWSGVLASLVGFLGDFDLAEEVTQDAFAAAAERWPVSGTPANPREWLVTTTRHRAIDRGPPRYDDAVAGGLLRRPQHAHAGRSRRETVRCRPLQTVSAHRALS
ncbi:sigma factor [Streptomyces sp. M92]|uniref:sigma factor n=1 Tax=Streptomyces sp. M92 TaxID=2944250 RepID=UPI003FA6995B